MASLIDLRLDGDAAYPDLPTREVIHLRETTIGVTALAGGMASGRTSVALRLDLPDGRVVLAETSLRLLLAAADALRARYGAECAMALPEDLTPRERAILALLAAGHTDAAIADRIGLATGYTRQQGGVVYDKLGLPDDDRRHNRRVLAAVWWLRHGQGGR